MKLDAKHLRYLSIEEFRTLLSIELGMRNHDLVPTTLIERLADLRHGGTRKCLKSLARKKLIHHDSKFYDGYKLNYLGYDYLALNSFVKRGTVVGVGGQIGVGKESDIFVVIDAEDTERVLKLHRLGRISFRTIKNKRDYLKNRKSANWLYLSKLAAMKEYAFMKALYEAGYPTPQPLDQNRHCLVMERIDGYPLYQIREMADPVAIGRRCLDLIVQLAEHGLIHGDFNEFNLLVKEDSTVIVIDFPQMVSTDHKNAEAYFDRDVQCIHTYFGKKHGVDLDNLPKLSDITKSFDLDVAVSASGFSKEKEKELRKLQKEQDLRLSTVDDEQSDEDEEEVPEVPGPQKKLREGNIEENITKNLMALRSEMEKVYETEVSATKKPVAKVSFNMEPQPSKNSLPSQEKAPIAQTRTQKASTSPQPSDAASHPAETTNERDSSQPESSDAQETTEPPTIESDAQQDGAEVVSVLQDAIEKSQKASQSITSNELLQQLIRLKVKRSHDARRKREKHTQSAKGNSKKGTKKIRNQRKSTKQLLNEYDA
uniref:Serine/threonine-protein kinase RIO2 n=1 Tax=Percolomonas cosmopolitus TaxID=63605 RepID=A0A7S1PIJ9_9EUKA